MIKADGWYARILQHEIDHLNGTLYIDRMKTNTFCSLENYNRHWKGKSADRGIASSAFAVSILFPKFERCIRGLCPAE